MMRLFAAITLAVLVYAPGDAAPAVRERVVTALHRRGVDVVERAVDTAQAARRAGWRPTSELAFFAEAARTMERAHEAREHVELEAALAGYTEAEAIYATHLSLPGVAALAAEAALERGAVLVELGRAADARPVFQQALDLWPELTLTERHARPDVVRLLREVARAPRTSLPAAIPNADAIATELESLRQAPTQKGVSGLLAALSVESVLVVAVDAEGTHALASRVEEKGATPPMPFALDHLDDAVAALLSRSLVPGPMDLSLEDARLRPAPVAALDVVAATPKPRPRRIWPWALAGAVVVGATVLGVTLAFVAADSRYSVKVNSANFAP